MSYMNMRSALSEYNKTAVQTGVGSASPHRLIQMLMEGALDKIAKARGYMERREIEAKGRHVSWAISIINGLRASLDHRAGGDLARNLDDLYDYMERRLLAANKDNDVAGLEEVAGLLRQIKDAWDAIPVDVQDAHARGGLGGGGTPPSAVGG